MKPFIMKNDIKKIAKEKFSVLSSSYSSFFPMKKEKFIKRKVNLITSSIQPPTRSRNFRILKGGEM